MFVQLSKMMGYTLLASDGEIGKVKDFYFDDQSWKVRYAVADTGNWVPRRKILLAPAAFRGRPDHEARLFPLFLSKELVRNSPGVDEDLPVSRQRELELARYYAWPEYWRTESSGIFPSDVEGRESSPAGRSREEETHVRSDKEVRGYRVQALDGEIGHVEDMIVDDSQWNIRFILVSTRNWLPGERKLISPYWLKNVDWARKNIYLELTRDQIRNAPEPPADGFLSEEFEKKIFDYYKIAYPERRSRIVKENELGDGLLKESVSQDLEITDPDDTIEEASKRMEVGDVGALPVVENTRLVGVVTDRDMVTRCIAQGKNPKKTKIRDVMSRDLVTCGINETLKRAGEIMEERKVRRLMVVNDEGAFVGVVSLGDLSSREPDPRITAGVLEGISEK